MAGENKEALDRLKKCRSNLVITHPFFASLLLTQKFIEQPNIPTIGTDGKNTYYNPKFILSLEDNHLRFVLGHEAMHVALGHPYRLYGRIHNLWNCAGDYCINRLLVKCGFDMPRKLDDEGKSIPHGLLDESGEFDGMHEDPIYDKLLEKAEKIHMVISYDQTGTNDPNNPANQHGGENKPKKGKGKQIGCGGIITPKNEDGQPMTREQAEAAAKEQNATLAAIANAAKIMGKLPADLERFIQAALEPTVPWQDILRQFIENVSKNDYSFQRPNRRYLQATGGAFFLPGLYSNELGHLVVAVDTSGSISQKELELFCSELNNILSICAPSEVTVIYCDASVNNVETFYPEDFPVKMQARGGGGTDFRPPFKYVKDNSIEPRALLYLTDMCCNSFPHPDDVPYPVLWCGTGYWAKREQEVPFGEVVLIGEASDQD